MNRAPLDYAPDDERIEPLEARPIPFRLILLAALAGLAPVAVFGAVLWRAMS